MSTTDSNGIVRGLGSDCDAVQDLINLNKDLLILSNLIDGLGIEGQVGSVPTGVAPNGTAYYNTADKKIYVYKDGVWIGFTPTLGMPVYDQSNGVSYVYTSSGLTSPVLPNLTLASVIMEDASQTVRWRWRVDETTKNFIVEFEAVYGSDVWVQKAYYTP